MSLASLVERAYADQITGKVTIPARPARYGQWGDWVPDSVRQALDGDGLGRPWKHQAEAAESIHSGIHTVLATGTGSGKSLAAWVPALSSIEESRSGRTSLGAVKFKPTVLYLSPTKALTADQENNLVELARKVNPRIAIATVDGDAEWTVKAWARDHADILLTNPDFAHYAILRKQQRWARLWRGLSMIVLDEFHSYKGMFGANVALVVRRILRVAAHYGASPTVVFLSATSGNPAASAQRFLGEAFGNVYVVSEDGSPAGEREIITMQSKEIPLTVESRRSSDEDSRVVTKSPETSAAAQPEDTDEGELDAPGILRNADIDAGLLTGLLAANGARTLTFVRSRKGTERVAELAQDYLARHAPHLDGTVAAYRGGYLPEERRELEQAMRAGYLRALATTNALELGIDISGLDTVVVSGWPGTHASFRQQIGRAGRAGGRGLGVFIGQPDPLDHYFLTNPNLLKEAPAEVAAFDPTNPWILPGHICSAAAELPLTAADAPVFSLPDDSLITELIEEGLLKERPTGLYWNTSSRVAAHDLVDLRSMGVTVSLVDSENGTLLGTVDAARADSTVHPGAIYLHQTTSYMAEERKEDVVLLHRHREEEIRTYSHENIFVDIVEAREWRDLGIGTWSLGTVVVRSWVIGYDVYRARDGLLLDYVPLHMPVRELITDGCWLTMRDDAVQQAGIEHVFSAVHAAEHTMVAMLPLFAICDRRDLGGFSLERHPTTERPTIIVHDTVPGGSGCAERGFKAGADWIEATLNTIKACPCKEGCPRCAQAPMCHLQNGSLSKDEARKLLAAFLPAIRG